MTINRNVLFVVLAQTQLKLVVVLDCRQPKNQIMVCHVHSNSIHGLRIKYSEQKQIDFPQFNQNTHDYN